MSSTPDVSVIVPTYNRAAYLPFCLDSLLSQTLPPREVIVVNDGSDDPTTEVLAKYDGQVTVLNKANGGKSSAVNLGLSAASGDLVWIMDDDDEAVPDALMRCVQSMKRAEDCAFGYGTKFTCTSLGNRRMGPVIGVTKVPAKYDRSFAIRLMRKNFLGAASVVVRRRAYDEIGPFDQSLIRSQDYEMAVRLALRYRGVRIQGGPIFFHRKHDGERGPAFERVSAWNRPLAWKKYTGRFMRRLHEQLPLSRYGPAECVSPEQRIVATLMRARIMAAHGLFDLVLDDLQSLREIDSDSTLSSDALTIGKHIVRHFVGEGGDAVQLKAVLAGGSEPVKDLFRCMRRHCLSAVVWNTVPETIQRRVRQTVSRFSAAAE